MPRSSATGACWRAAYDSRRARRTLGAPRRKVEPGESPDGALVREVAEELDCRIQVTGWLDGAVPIAQTHVLTVAAARLTSGEPSPTEHDLVRWLSADELEEVDWLEPDRPFLPELAALLRGSPEAGAPRAIFFDEDAARAVRARLESDGYGARVVRELLAGEDDDEDHPWAVLSDAPGFVLELLVDEHDGWLDHPDEAPRRPLDLPSAPKRIKRP